MPIDPVTAPAPGGMYATAPSRVPQQQMDSKVFMTLLVTQLQHQDPGSPMDTNAMIGQTTQLAMMERLTELSAQGEEAFGLQMRAAAAALIGKKVSYAKEDGTEVTGIASSVSFEGAVPRVKVGDATVPLDQISGIVS
ncbi:flagellar hook capping protein [Arthrobacter sp. MSA 4-2]|uniref:flagellar hook assembly protein FlgD n=1 Tax=Arthrobacter sp. MSA 4-2 TaxID=2794349 RepID=UPI0018E72479|nr:flagellar hook capping FlgD N-terminal domain-containing protein [Arthrobacter sp. MSA 4-2]MBJ2120579.1 flagellar hook capping protein [Arthrobacter sp. MSA 4-2]